MIKNLKIYPLIKQNSKNIFSLLVKFFLLNLICLSPFSRSFILLSENKVLIPEDYLIQKRNNDFYILGPGDKFSLRVIDNDFLVESNAALKLVDVKIDGSGYTTLPRLNRVYVAGLTIDELIKILNKEYSKYINKPNVGIEMTEYRPVKVYIDGEVEYPGLHVLKGSSLPVKLLNPTLDDFYSEKSLLAEDKYLESELESNTPTSLDDNLYFPTIIDVLRSAQGITLNANLSNIEIVRKNSISNGGGKITTNIDLSQVINMKDQTQNIRVLDGDMILVKKTAEPIFSQISKSIKTNINPRFIRVFLGGRVQEAGSYKVNTTATLTDALLLGGGTKILKGKVVFLRYKNDGTIDRRKFRFNSRAESGSYNNPFLKNGDIVFLEKSLLGKTSEVLSEITAPLSGIVSSMAFYKIITD